MAGIIVELSVDDRGTVTMKQFSDEAKKAIEEMKRVPEEAKGPLDLFKMAWMGPYAKSTSFRGEVRE
jgi:hypothetical protein